MAEGDIQNLRARRAVAQMDRDQLEDKHLRLMEENLVLKKHARSQEEKIKRMATKLIRLTSDGKKEAKRDGQPLAAIHLHQRDLETEDMISDLQSKLRELEKQNTSLKGKVAVLKQQLQTHGKRHTPYDHIQSKISTGLSKKGVKSAVANDVPVKTVSTSSNAGTQCTTSCHNLLEEVRSDNQELEETALQLQQRVAVLTAENERSKEQLRAKSLRSEEEKLQLQEELQAQITVLQKSNTDSEIEMLKLQRDLRDKVNRLQTLQAKYLTVERNVEATKSSHSRVLKELELLNNQLKEERSRNSELQTELHSKTITQKANSELQEMIRDLKAEKELLKQANDRFIRSDSDRDEQQRAQIRVLQEQIREIESSSREDHSEKARVIKQLANERELSNHLDSELRELRVTYHRLKDDYDKLQDKLKFFSKESSIDWREVEEALTVVRRNKEKGLGALSFLEQVEDDVEDKPRSLEEQRLAHAETISELEKTRKLLQIQHSINNDYKKEIENLKSKLLEKEDEHNSQLREYAQLLDIRSARVKKLECQLKDIAYGSRPYKIDTSKFEFVSGSGLDDTIELERGQNLLQLNISQIVLTPEAVSHLHNSNPALFVTYAFYDFETQVTPVMQGTRPQFNFTSNFVLMVDDAFLSYLQKGVISIELNQALGLKYLRLAVASVKLVDLITSGGGRIHGKVPLTGVDNMEPCVNVGNLEYWMKLKQPVTQAIRLYQERNKALSILEQQTASSISMPSSASTPQGPDYNELLITMKNCYGLDTGKPDHSPCAYIMYKFYTYPDHDTPIISHSTDPQFSDDRLFPISMNHHLDTYLGNETLDVYVFDDEETDDSTYLGLAQVPLSPLAQGKIINGHFQLTNVSNAPVGYVEVELKWKHPYHIQINAPISSSHPNEQKTSGSVKPAPALKSNAESEPKDIVKSKPSIRTAMTLDVNQDIITDSDIASMSSEVSESPTFPPVVAVKPIAPSSHRAPPKPNSKKTAKTTLLARATKANTKTDKDSTAMLKNSLPPLQRAPTEPKDNVVLAPQLKETATSESERDSDVFQVTETEVSSMSGLPSDNERPTQSTPPVEEEEGDTLRGNEPSEEMILKPGIWDTADLAVIEGGADGEGDDITVVSETVESFDEEDTEEELKEEITDEGENSEMEDTMFQETTDNGDFSGLSEHSSDELHLTINNDTLKQPIHVEESEAESATKAEENSVTPFESESEQAAAGEAPISNTISITVESFTTEESSPLSSNKDITNIFVEYQFLDYDYGELETPTSLPKPQPGESAVYNFKKILQLDAEKESLLRAMLQPGDGRITFTVVSDPEDQGTDCVDLGTAEMDLNEILQRGEDIHGESIDVYSVDEDPEIIGFLNVSIEALDVLTNLVKDR